MMVATLTNRGGNRHLGRKCEPEHEFGRHGAQLGAIKSGNYVLRNRFGTINRFIFPRCLALRLTAVEPQAVLVVQLGFVDWVTSLYVNGYPVSVIFPGGLSFPEAVFTATQSESGPARPLIPASSDRRLRSSRVRGGNRQDPG